MVMGSSCVSVVSCGAVKYIKPGSQRDVCLMPENARQRSKSRGLVCVCVPRWRKKSVSSGGDDRLNDDLFATSQLTGKEKERYTETEG